MIVWPFQVMLEHFVICIWETADIPGVWKYVWLTVHEWLEPKCFKTAKLDVNVERTEPVHFF